MPVVELKGDVIVPEFPGTKVPKVRVPTPPDDVTVKLTGLLMATVEGVAVIAQANVAGGTVAGCTVTWYVQVPCRFNESAIVNWSLTTMLFAVLFE